MLISLDNLINKYNINFKGILHVGAHHCEELGVYEKYVNRKNILWVEAMSDKVEYCIKKYPNLKIEQGIISDKVENVKFNVSNNGQSSSFLEFGLHTKYHPNVHFIKSYKEETKTLSSILPKYNIDINFVNLDIQGAELKALKGMEKYLDKIDYIYTEVNKDHVYKNCTLISELDDYLNKFDFKRVETKWTGCKWGDAFYIKNNLI